MSAKEVYNRIRLLNLKRAKLKQKKAELKIYTKKEETELINQTTEEITMLEKEIQNLA